MTTRYPRLRASDRCPLCGRNKMFGTLCCTGCYPPDEPHDPWAIAQFMAAEKNLTAADVSAFAAELAVLQ